MYNNNRLWISAAIILVATFIGFTLSVPRAVDVPPKEEHPAVVSVIQDAQIVRLDHSYTRGVYTLNGFIAVPNACTKVTAEALLNEDDTSSKRILLALSYSLDTGVCLQLPADMRFETKITAPRSLPIDVTVNGQAAKVEPL